MTARDIKNLFWVVLTITMLVVFYRMAEFYCGFNPDPELGALSDMELTVYMFKMSGMLVVSCCVSYGVVELVCLLCKRLFKL